jgi:bifunctional UDP-N-acetylglucosamine pyrophosphorylase/glucosamine-1-phosphate N-acetyltransferase
MKTTAVILAAGQGTRMHSELPKILHPLSGRPLIGYALKTAQQVTGGKPVVVIGHQAEIVRPAIDEDADIVLQEPQSGTGHALQQAESLLRGKTDLVLVLTADMPLLTFTTLAEIVRIQENSPGPFTMLSLLAEEARGFGRIVRNTAGEVVQIVEEAAASTEQLAIHEVNAGVYCFRSRWLWNALPQISRSAKGEYYLTDLVQIATEKNQKVKVLVTEDQDECIGINNRIHLAQAEAILRRRINQFWMLQGVSMIDPETTYIEEGVTIGQDTLIMPNTHLLGSTSVGRQCVLGPNTIVRDTTIGDSCEVFSSVLEEAVIEDRVDIGPFAHLRKGAYLSAGVHMGNFGEVKNSRLGPGVKMGHFSYVGDADIGGNVNIGAGTITCNFGLDGKKNKTEIGEGAFIGSDTLLIAPVKVGKGAATGSGAVVTKDVPPGMLAVGMPARAIRKLVKDD